MSNAKLAAVPISLEVAVRKLVIRSRVAAVCTPVLWTGLVLALGNALGLPPEGFIRDTPTVTITFLVVLPGILLGAGPWINAGLLRKVGATLGGIPNVRVTKIRGSYIARLSCEINPADPRVPPLVLRFLGGMVGEYGGEPAEFRLALPWDFPADIFAFQRWAYSDFPSAINDVENLRRNLGGSDMLWSEVAKARLESTMRPGWGRLLKRDESTEEFRVRLMVRWQQMEAIRRMAAAETRFSPVLLPEDHDFPTGIGSFHAAMWCPRCSRRVRTFDFDPRRACPRCGNPVVYLFYREPWDSLGNWLKEKMRRVRERYQF